jgi:serine/threonine-protein kinase
MRCGLIVHAYGQKGLFAEAIADIEAHHPPPGTDPPWYWSELAYIYGRSGQTALVQQALDRLLAVNRHQEVDAAAIAIAYVGMDNKDQALAWLEKAYAQHSNALTELKVDARYDPLHGEPRFQDLLRRVGLDQ